MIMGAGYAKVPEAGAGYAKPGAAGMPGWRVLKNPRYRCAAARLVTRGLQHDSGALRI